MIDQEHISQKLVGPTYKHPETEQPYHGKGKFDHQRDRINQVSRKDDEFQNFHVGIQDMDDAVMFYLREVIKPVVTVDGNSFTVPIIYGTPERWKAVQKEGFFRDKDGKRQVPVIVFKRNALKKVRNISTKLDANRPYNTYTTARHYSRRNPYDSFYKVLNRKEEYEYITTVIPDFVELEYSCTILTDYMEQMNPILESINFASDSYWGRREKFKFHSFISDIRTEIMENQSEDRTIKSDFNIKLNGYIVPQTVNSNAYVHYKKRNLTNYKISFAEKTMTGSEELEKVL